MKELFGIHLRKGDRVSNRSGITNTSRQIFINGRNAGNRINVFSKVGDSITISGAFLNGFGVNKYNLRDYQQDLEPVVKFYSQETARNSNSFANTSLAADTNWSTASIFLTSNSNKTLCNTNEIPLICEYRIVRPAVALIMLGTNDVPGIPIEAFQRNMRLIIEITTQMGTVPIISTIPPMLNRSDASRVLVFNTLIKALAREYDVPLLDYWAALQPLPNFGIANDGVHPTFSQQYSTDFTPDAMLYGMTVRNLTALQALDAVWRTVLK